MLNHFCQCKFRCLRLKFKSPGYAGTVQTIRLMTYPPLIHLRSTVSLSKNSTHPHIPRFLPHLGLLASFQNKPPPVAPLPLTRLSHTMHTQSASFDAAVNSPCSRPPLKAGEAGGYRRVHVPKKKSSGDGASSSFGPFLGIFGPDEIFRLLVQVLYFVLRSTSRVNSSRVCDLSC